MTTKSSSSSSSQATTQTINEDNRVVGEAGSTTLGKGAVLQINNELPETVAEVFSQFIDLARDAGTSIVESSRRAVETAEKALDTVARSGEKSLDTVAASGGASLSTVANIQDKVNQGNDRIFTDIFPLLAAGIIGLVAIQFLRRQ